jgi:MSHA pilin protein MshC
MSVNNSKNRSLGFTLIEMVTVMVIIGILAVVAVPRFAGSDVRPNQFHDQVVSVLRYAQKTATSHRRPVCVSFTATSLQVNMAASFSATCGLAVILPGSTSNTLQSPNASSVFFSPTPSTINFQTDGTTTSQTISIAGQPNIVVVGATGYVN